MQIADPAGHFSNQGAPGLVRFDLAIAMETTKGASVAFKGNGKDTLLTILRSWRTLSGEGRMVEQKKHLEWIGREPT